MSDTKVKIVGVWFEWFSHGWPDDYVPPSLDCFIGAGSTPIEAAQDFIEALRRECELDQADELALLAAAASQPAVDEAMPYCIVRLALVGGE